MTKSKKYVYRAYIDNGRVRIQGLPYQKIDRGVVHIGKNRVSVGKVDFTEVESLRSFITEMGGYIKQAREAISAVEDSQ